MSDLGSSNLAGSPQIVIAEHSMPIREMFGLYNKQETGFGIAGYKVPAAYLDTRQMKDDRENTNKKKAPRPTKTSDYLTQTVKLAGKTPGPIYNVVKPWADETKKSSAPKNVGDRKTYLASIEEEAKRRPVPGPGAYDVLKKNDKKPMGTKGKGGERAGVVSEAEYMAETTPGPGNYNPRTIQPKIRPAKMKPEEWRKKHKDESGKKNTLPDIGTYTPLAASFDTFDRIQERSKSNKNGNPKTWGTDIRFTHDKKTKRVDVSPGPGEYKVTADWAPDAIKGKSDKKHFNLFNSISKGISTSIYYS